MLLSTDYDFVVRGGTGKGDYLGTWSCSTTTRKLDGAAVFRIND